MEFPEISETIRDDLFFAKLANDCLITARQHITTAIANREAAGEPEALTDLLSASQQIEAASVTLSDYGYVELEKEGTEWHD